MSTLSQINHQTMQNKQLVLASGSIYRKQLLNKLGLEFFVSSPDIDESGSDHELPDELAIRLARQKAEAVMKNYPNHLIIGSDQVAVCKGRQLKKPGNYDNNIQQLKLLSGQKADFHTSVWVLDSSTGQSLYDIDLCQVYFKTLTERQIKRYVDKEKAFFCAGGFKAESLGVALFEEIKCQDPSALIGLPLIKLCALLEQFGITIL